VEHPINVLDACENKQHTARKQTECYNKHVSAAAASAADPQQEQAAAAMSVGVQTSDEHGGGLAEVRALTACVRALANADNPSVRLSAACLNVLHRELLFLAAA
jgi:hypothetical protein